MTRREMSVIKCNLDSAAEYAAKNSTDPTTQVGSVLVDGANALSYFGANVNTLGLSRDEVSKLSKQDKYRITIHAEQMAITSCFKSHNSPIGGTLYVTHPPCEVCANLIVRVGIVRVVFYTPTDDVLTRWKDSFYWAKKILEHNGVLVKEVSPASLLP